MTDNFFVVLNKKGFVRANKTYPDLRTGEFTVEITATVPDAFFIRPRLRATLVVAEDAIQAPGVSTEIVEGIRQSVKAGTGIDLNISIAEAPE